MAPRSRILFAADGDFATARMRRSNAARPHGSSSSAHLRRDDSAKRRVKIPITIAPEALDFTQLIRAGETIGWAEATAEPVFLTRMLDAQAERCPPYRVFFALTFSAAFAAGHANVTVTALGGASAGRRFFACDANNVVPANISDVSSLVATGRLPIDIVLLQISGPDETGRYNAQQRWPPLTPLGEPDAVGRPSRILMFCFRAPFAPS